MTIRRILLSRRRFDAVLLAAGFAALAAMLSIGKVVFILFAVCGIYLAAIRHRTIRQWTPAFAVTLSAWALWQIGLSLARGEPIAGNRVLSYAGLELALVFLPLGLCLVRRPLDALATGARIGLLVLLVATPIQFAMIGGRVGLGVNEAIFAFVAGIVGLAARLPAQRPLRFLPNGPLWTYLATVPIVLSGTRAALVLMLMTAVLDLYTLFALRRRTRQQTWTLLGAIAAVVVVGAYPVGSIVANRFEAGVVELKNFEATGNVTGSADVRLVMWRSAASVLAEHPWLGVGGTVRMDRVAEKAGGNAYMVTYYEHLHNFFFDEALSSGLIGFALLVSVFAAFLVAVFRSRANQLERETACVLVAFLVLFGSFHGVLLNEWTLIAVFGTMSVLLTKLRRETLAARHAPSQSR
ncbi:O-antigen ligase family protein [Aureimonas pseudogalii]|uniref:O-antigen ligase n=1 Tax=Aureimonas pseudogalii TaxID=1744844 RepID=A0A7W6H5A1_9HYPH|nr:O-antigen ligase family protein [Aureimonas pseudogalii]MBB3998808.1 O-antigen ligase [Aureimonas pseudogalii]